MWHLINTAQLRRIQETLDQLVQEVSQLVDEATFDQQLTDLNNAIDELITAVNAHVAAAPDLTDESQAVLNATDKVKAASDAIAAQAAAPPTPDAPPADTSEAPPA